MLTTLLSLFVAAATQSPLATPPPEVALVPAIVDFGLDGTKDVLSAPATVRVGEPFELKITTFGGGCVREGEASVIFLATGAAVMVYDLTVATHPGVICTAVIKRMPHTVKLRFDKPGEAIIQIWGRRVGPETPPFGIPKVLEHGVTVRN